MSNNIEFDKFYTPRETAKRCIDLFLNEVDGITEVIEPAAGDGSFSLILQETLPYGIDVISYDISPEHQSIIKQDFLELDAKYKKGRAIIGNPPFGDRNNMARSFYKKACNISDYIGFVLPISQLDNKDSLYDFDLVSSTDLGNGDYSGFNVHCCFNTYKRPESGRLNGKPRYNSTLFDIYRDDQDGYSDMDYDICIGRWGSRAGAEITENINRTSYKIVVHNKNNIDYVREKILGFDWMGYKKHQSAPAISKNDIYRLFL